MASSSLILNIDTAVEAASVCLSANGAPLALVANPYPRESAAWLPLGIQQLMDEQGVALSQLSAIAVSAGPGSYTGLRVGMATAKGLCYALQKPLIAIGTLHMMAAALQPVATRFVCPMIDARRMEVFTALFDASLTELVPPAAVVLQPDTFAAYLQRGSITFLGNGSHKFKALLQHPGAFFADVVPDASHMAPISHAKLISNNFSALAYAEPAYGKEFFSPARNK